MTSVKIRETLRAFKYSEERVRFGESVLISHVRPTELPPTIKFRYTSQIRSIDEYSFKMIYELPVHIETKFALVIQYDGFIVNHSSWRDDFLDYDYIGAPFPLPSDPSSYRDVFGNVFRVGNGGFSLRSAKLMNLPLTLGLTWHPFHGYFNEDGFICARYRHIYEQHGCRFAPFEVARFFSHETMLPEFEGVLPFGFHGRSNNYYKTLA
jgi:hypothetical protein